MYVLNFLTKLKSISIDDQILDAALATGATMGVEGHVWFSFLDRAIVQRTWRNIFTKVILDQTIAAPVYTLTYIIGKKILIYNLISCFFFRNIGT